VVRLGATLEDVAVLDLLRELVDQVRGLRQDLRDRDRRPLPLSRQDRARDRDLPCHPNAARFLAAVAASARGHVFSAAELVAHGQTDADLCEALNGRTSRQVGKQLRALADHPVEGLVVRRIGRDGDGTIWAVQVADLHADAGAHADRGA
jgi:hypothetical protein